MIYVILGVVIYFLIGCIAVIQHVKSSESAHTDVGFMIFLIVGWPFLLLATLVYGFVDFLIRIGKALR